MLLVFAVCLHLNIYNFTNNCYCSSLSHSKSTLVKQIKKPLTEKNGFYVEGKFDKSTRPDKVLASALDSFFADVTASNVGENASISMLMRWRISDAVGSGVSCLYDSIPSLRKFMDDGTEVDGSEGRKIAGNSLDQRLKYMFCKLIGAIPCRSHTLVLVLDDLQVSVRLRLRLYISCLEFPYSLADVCSCNCIHDLRNSGPMR